MDVLLPDQSQGIQKGTQNTDISEAPRWYVLRDLKRPNAKTRAYALLQQQGFEVFTPLKWICHVVRGKKKRRQVPVLYDLLFVHTTRQLFDPVIETVPTLQYRFVRGGYCKPLIVSDFEMEQFVRAVTQGAEPQMYTVDELNQLSIGRDVKIIGGALDGVIGKIVNVRGSKKRRILVSIPDLIAAVVEVDPEFVSLI